MHERQTALTGALLALMLLGAAPARAEKDAAMKAREGEINHWIEYYRKDRAPAAASSPGAVVEEARGKRKGKG
jgi:hypothetical protein